MANIFDSITLDIPQYKVVSRCKLTGFGRTEITEGNFGLLACFYTASNCKRSIPISTNSREVEIGEHIDPKDMRLLTLQRGDDEDVLFYRIEIL